MVYRVSVCKAKKPIFHLKKKMQVEIWTQWTISYDFADTISLNMNVGP